MVSSVLEICLKNLCAAVFSSISCPGIFKFCLLNINSFTVQLMYIVSNPWLKICMADRQRKKTPVKMFKRIKRWTQMCSEMSLLVWTINFPVGIYKVISRVNIYINISRSDSRYLIHRMFKGVVCVQRVCSMYGCA